jgi:hypothetical protein
MNSRNMTGTTPHTGKTDDIPALRKPQIRILKCLADGRARTKPQIVKDARVERGWCTSYLGSNDPEKRAYNDAREFPSLITLGYIRSETVDAGGKDVYVYEITEKGRKVAARLANQ